MKLEHKEKRLWPRIFVWKPILEVRWKWSTGKWRSEKWRTNIFRMSGGGKEQSRRMNVMIVGPENKFLRLVWTSKMTKTMTMMMMMMMMMNWSDWRRWCQTCIVVEKVERKPATAFHRTATGAVSTERPQQMTRRLERRKLQRNRTAFTQSQIEQLEQGSSHDHTL